jgi:hypothetical protein
MDPNTYVLAAVLNMQLQKQKGALPPEADFSPFNLSVLCLAPGDNDRPETGQSIQAQAQGSVEAFA